MIRWKRPGLRWLGCGVVELSDIEIAEFINRSGLVGGWCGRVVVCANKCHLNHAWHWLIQLSFSFSPHPDYWSPWSSQRVELGLCTMLMQVYLVVVAFQTILTTRSHPSTSRSWFCPFPSSQPRHALDRQTSWSHRVWLSYQAKGEFSKLKGKNQNENGRFPSINKIHGVIIGVLRNPFCSIRAAVFTVSPKRQ